MAPKPSLAIPVAAFATVLLLLLIYSEVAADGSALSPVSDNIGRAVTATKEMAQDVTNSAAPKAGEVGQAVKDTAKSAADSVSPIVDKAGDAAEDATNSLGSWFKDKLADLGIISRGPSEQVKSP